MNLIRAALVASAVVVLAWLAFSLRAVDLQADAAPTIDGARHGRVGASKIDAARKLLRRADTRNPDLSPLLDEGLLLFYAGRRDEAYPLARRAVAKEPENVQAWTLLYLVAPNTALANDAKSKVQHLNPWLGDSLR